MRPCTNDKEKLREEIARQTAEYLASGKTVEQFGYCVKTEYQDNRHRNPDGTLTGSAHHHLFAK
jgi:hypothetical protein